MANNNFITIDSTFVPFTYEELAQPLVDQTTMHLGLQDKYTDVSDELAKWENMLDPIKDKELLAEVQGYKNTLTDQVSQLNEKGLMASSFKAFSDLRKKYKSLSNIETYNSALKEIINNQRENNKTGDAIFSTDSRDLSVEALRKNPSLADYSVLHKDAIYKYASEVSMNLASRIVSKPELLAGFNSDYELWSQSMGYEPGSIAAAIEGNPNAPSELSRLIDQAITYFGIDNKDENGNYIFSEAKREEAKQAIYAGIDRALINSKKEYDLQRKYKDVGGSSSGSGPGIGENGVWLSKNVLLKNHPNKNLNKTHKVLEVRSEDGYSTTRYIVDTKKRAVAIVDDLSGESTSVNFDELPSEIQEALIDERLYNIQLPNASSFNMVGLKNWSDKDNQKITLADGNSISTDLGKKQGKNDKKKGKVKQTTARDVGDEILFDLINFSMGKQYNYKKLDDFTKNLIYNFIDSNFIIMNYGSHYWIRRPDEHIANEDLPVKGSRSRAFIDKLPIQPHDSKGSSMSPIRSTEPTTGVMDFTGSNPVGPDMYNQYINQDFNAYEYGPITQQVNSTNDSRDQSTNTSKEKVVRDLKERNAQAENVKSIHRAAINFFNKALENGDLFIDEYDNEVHIKNVDSYQDLYPKDYTAIPFDIAEKIKNGGIFSFYMKYLSEKDKKNLRKEILLRRNKSNTRDSNTNPSQQTGFGTTLP